MSEKTLCPNCGTVIFPEDQFCSSCGHSLVLKPPTEERPSIEPSRPIQLSPPTPTSNIDELKSHVQIIAIVEIVFAVIAIIVGIFSFVAAVFVPILIASEDPKVGNPDYSGTDPTIIAVFVGIFIFIFAIMAIIVGIMGITYGRKLMNYEKAGRFGTMVIAAIHLIIIPFGTIYGVAALYVLTRPEIDQVLT